MLLSVSGSLFIKGRLVHGDLSEYNILLVPACLVENRSKGIENPNDEMQAVLIDFGQTVDVMHPDALMLLQRDLERVNSFFARQDIGVLTPEQSLSYVIDEEDRPLFTT